MVHSNHQQTSHLLQQRLAAVLAHPQQNVGLVIEELLRGFQCKTVIITPDYDQIIEYIDSQQVNILIIDDTQEQPSPFLLRKLIMHPLASIMPSLVLLNPQRTALTQVIRTMGRPMVAVKPLTPARFVPAFKTLLDVWSKGHFRAISAARILLGSEKREDAVAALLSLAQNTKVQPLVTSTICHYLRANRNLKAAEKLLLQGFKQNPQDFGVILTLSAFYLYSSMPNTALRLINTVEEKLGEQFIFMLDKLAAYLALQDLEQAIDIYKNLLAHGAWSQSSQKALLRCLFSEGRVKEFLQLMNNDAEARAFSATWGKTQLPNPIIKAS